MGNKKTDNKAEVRTYSENATVWYRDRIIDVSLITNIEGYDDYGTAYDDHMSVIKEEILERLNVTEEDVRNLDNIFRTISITISASINDVSSQKLITTN